jgi:ketosteroid isomerase-like protein
MAALSRRCCLAGQTSHPTFFQVVDSGNIPALIEFMTEDAVFRYGSQPPVQGRQAIYAYMSSLKTAVVTHHQVLHSWNHGDSLVVQGEATFDLPNNGHKVLPFVDVFHLRDKKIYDYRIYIDPTPLFMG